jgi:hypothetical protein
MLSSSGWNEIHPTQFALHAGEDGTGHSHLPKKNFAQRDNDK